MIGFVKLLNIHIFNAKTNNYKVKQILLFVEIKYVNLLLNYVIEKSLWKSTTFQLLIIIFSTIFNNILEFDYVNLKYLNRNQKVNQILLNIRNKTQ